jgi:hypothetical protein
LGSGRLSQSSVKGSDHRSGFSLIRSSTSCSPPLESDPLAHVPINNLFASSVHCRAMAMLPCSTTRTMQRSATASKAAVQHQQAIHSSLVCKALPDRQQQVASVAAVAATVSVLSSIAFAPVALADLNVYEAAAGGGLRCVPAAASDGACLCTWATQPTAGCSQVVAAAAVQQQLSTAAWWSCCCWYHRTSAMNSAAGLCTVQMCHNCPLYSFGGGSGTVARKRLDCITPASDCFNITSIQCCRRVWHRQCYAIWGSRPAGQGLCCAGE